MNIIFISLALCVHFGLCIFAVSEMRKTNEYLCEIIKCDDKKNDDLLMIRANTGSMAATLSTIRIDTHLIKCGL